MTYPNDFNLTCAKMEQRGYCIDSYALLSGIIENYNIQFRLDNSLPIVNGDCELLEEAFKGFVLNAVSEFKDLKGTLHIVYRKDLESSFLAFFIQGSVLPEDEKNVTNLVETITDLNFAICRKVLNQDEHIVKSPFLN
ncbi:hypothetical protein [Algoriphagus sp. Y33]|uniref:hypothetical protein n=1 Tax=Algoriphagus sp. Y33 TaxID=2772483 RepID=UPI00177AD94A|nr:hypothetical protein [Algoriphagus sp. Y33]